MKIVRNIFLFIISLVLIIYLGMKIQANLFIVKDKCLVIYAWINRQNQMVAGAISLWALGTLSYLAKGIPRQIWAWVVKQTTVTLTINNEDDIYDYFLAWYHETGRSKKARTLVARGVKNNRIVIHNRSGGQSQPTKDNVNISAGYGIHYFTYGFRIFQFSRDEKEAIATTQVKESITLKTIGRSQSQFHKLIKELIPKRDDTDLTTIYKWNNRDDWWRSFGSQMSRKFESVILPTTIKTKIVGHIKTFLRERDWYIDHGIPYRTGIILHGIPGTGKTSFVQALCTKFNKELYVLSLAGLNDCGLQEALKEVPRNSIILLEDLDTYEVAESRLNADGKDEPIMRMLSLSGLLNAIDGVIASDGRILIATTNHIEKLDPALTRKGRFNLEIELSYLTRECFEEFFKKFYPDFILEKDVEFKTEVTPATLQALILDNRDKPEAVLSEVCIN